MPEHISVVTANTHMTEALRDPTSVAYFAQHDVVLLQEAVLPETELAGIFSESELEPIIASKGLGLAILAHKDIAVRSVHKSIIDKPRTSFRSTAAEPEADGHVRFRARGLLSANIELSSGHALTVATAHPTVPAKVRARNRQIRALTQLLPPYQTIVLGGDMNHWPSPRRVDQQFRVSNQLRDAIEARTFDVSKTRYAKLGYLARLGIPVNGQLDALLYRGNILVKNVSVDDIASDHRAISARFEFTT